MRSHANILVVLCLSAAALLTAPGLAETPIAPKPAPVDARAALRAQVESELALRRARLKLIEEELRKQSQRYDEMASQKMELAKISAEKQQANREAAAEKAAKAQLAKAQAGGPKKATAPKGGAAKDKEEPPADAKAESKGSAGGGTAKKIDPMLTQNYLVLRLRDEARQLGERIAYLESVLARL